MNVRIKLYINKIVKFYHLSKFTKQLPLRPAADMGTAWHENHTAWLTFSRVGGSALDSARAALLYGNNMTMVGLLNFLIEISLVRERSGSRVECVT